VNLNAHLIEGFAGLYLSSMYDNKAPTPPFHREVWELYCSEALAVAVAAPRGHAKSTGFTHSFGSAAALFRLEPHILIVSATEELAMGHLGDISAALHDNDDLRAEFGIKTFHVDAKAEIVVECEDGYQFRFIARGAGQKLRGMKWRGRRPGLVLCDDIEEDEQVENPDRRKKFRKWVMRALLPLMRKGGKIRWHGTIMHEDAMLARLMKDSEWESRLYKAHTSFDDFAEILWPEMFDEAALRKVRQKYINQGDGPGYSQEYLNDPLDLEDKYLQEGWFIPMTDGDRRKSKLVCAAADFGITKNQASNRTSLTIGGMCVDNLLHFIDQRVSKWDSLEIVQQLFKVHDDWHPDVFWVESGQIWAALKPMLTNQMLQRGIFINFVERAPIKDKPARGRSLQRRMRAGGTRWDTESSWFEPQKEEMLRFTEHSDATLDDQFDSSALLSLGFDEMAVVDEEDFVEEDELEMRRTDPRVTDGRSQVTGY
jgi:hypothetical protein